jgi:protease I
MPITPLSTRWLRFNRVQRLLAETDLTLAATARAAAENLNTRRENLNEGAAGGEVAFVDRTPLTWKAPPHESPRPPLGLLAPPTTLCTVIMNDPLPRNGQPRPAVLLIVGDASETLDTLYPYYRLQEAGFEPVVAGPEQRTFQMVMHEVRPGWTITKEWEGYQIKADIAFADVDPEKYFGIFFSGGRAPEYIRYDADLVRITRHFFAAGKPIASVCHGVEIPAYAGCLEGRRITTVAKCRHDVESAGGIYVDAPCVVDGNLVSGRTYHDNGRYLGAWIEQLVAAAAACNA